MTGKNQSYARCLNNRIVMRELREADLSATMLSEKLDLSNAAMTSIISSLLSGGYIKRVEEESPSGVVGRHQVFYTVNEKFGYVVAVGMYNYKVDVVAADMKMNILRRIEMNAERYDMAMLGEVVKVVKELTGEPCFDGIPLLGIDIAVPGKVNTLTGELQLSPQFDRDICGEGNAIVNLFSTNFGVPVVMNNDINLAGLGEMYKGTLRNVDSAMLVDIGEGIGGAFIFHGSLYAGFQGFAGEVGLVHTNFLGHTGVLDEFVSFRAMKERLGADKGRKLTTDDVAALYKTDDAVRSYIDETAKCLGNVFKDFVEVLNISKIVLSGQIKRLGDKYLDVVIDAVRLSDNECDIVYSELGDDAAIVGAIYKAVENLTDDRFK